MGAPLFPAVTVNGVEIAPSAIAAEAQNHPAPRTKPGLAWRAAARALALREAMLQEARGRGLAAKPQEIAPGQWETQDEALIRAFLDHAIRPAKPDEALLRRHYEAGLGKGAFRLDAADPGSILPFEVVLPGLRAAAERVEWARAARGLVAEVMARARITGLSTGKEG